MAIDDTFMAELETAVEAVVETKTEDAADVTTDVGAETGTGEAGTADHANADDVGETVAESEGTEGGGSETAPVDESETVTPPTISDAALTEAVQHGISLEDARLFPNEASLKRAVQAVRKSVEAVIPREKVDTVEEDILSKLPVLDKEQYEPEVIAAFNAYSEVLKKQEARYKQLEDKFTQSITSTEQARQAASEQEVAAWFDGQISKLGEEFKDVVGTGATDALSPTSHQRAKREAIANQAAILLAGYQATGTQPASRDDVFKQAARLVLADEYEKASAKKVAAGLEKRSKQHIQRASGNQKAKIDGDPAEIAAEALRQQFPQLGR